MTNESYENELNQNANIREKLIDYLMNQSVTTSDSLKLQASILGQVMEKANELTRQTLVSETGPMRGRCVRWNV